MFDEADVAVGRTIGAGHTYEPHILNFFRQHLKPGMTVIDAGANIGYFTLYASRLVGQEGHVYACEPNSENCRLILLSLQQNDITNVTLLPVALGTQIGSAPFTPAMGSNGQLLLQEGHSSLLNPNCIVVPIFPLDNLVDRNVDFIKADTEGSEGNIVRGAINLITKSRPIIVTEYSPVMLKQNSHMDPNDYLEIFLNLNYQISMLLREEPDKAPVVINDIGDFVANFGSPHRIEDLAFIPKERL